MQLSSSMLLSTLFLIYHPDATALTAEDPRIEAEIAWQIFLQEVRDIVISSGTSDPTGTITEKFDHLMSKNASRFIADPRQQLDAFLANLRKEPEITCGSNKTLKIEGTILKSSRLVEPLTCDGHQPNLIEIFASDTIIFDHDVDLSGLYGLLAICAPRWSIPAARTINLDGLPFEGALPKAPGGRVGQPGGPGNTAGSFYGFGRSFEKGALLKVTANGGSGGKGQDGGDGGEVGGNGGSGGYGGFGGNVEIVAMVGRAGVRFESENGYEGRFGLGGSPGLGEVSGDAWSGDQLEDGSWKDLAKFQTAETVGHVGFNNENMAEPKATIAVKDHRGRIVNDYKSFLAKRMESGLLKDPVLDFFGLGNTHTTESLLEDFRNLENEFLLSQGPTDFGPQYQNLLRHIRDTEPPENANNRTLAMLHVTVMGKICALQVPPSGGIITNLDKFLEVCIGELKHVKEMTVGDYKAEIHYRTVGSQHLVDHLLIPEIKDTAVAINGRIKDLSREMIQIQGDKYELWNRKEQLENNLLGHIVVDTLDRVGAVMSFCGLFARAQATQNLESELPKQLSTMMEALKTPQDLSKAFDEDMMEDEVISGQVEESKRVLEQAQSSKTEIFANLVPVLEAMDQGLGTAPIRLEIDKVGSSLGQASEILGTLVKKLDVGNAITRLVNISMDALNAIIKLYDTIGSFQKCSDYLDLVHSTQYGPADEIRRKVEDEIRKKAEEELGQYVEYNMILQKYRQPLTQIEQFAFPLPRSFFLEPLSIADPRQNAITQLENLRRKLQYSRMNLTESDDMKLRAEFFDFSSAGPFFVWPNRTHHDSIAKLLVGEEVLFFADSSASAKIGVKFHRIGLRLKSPTNQENVDEVLDDFAVVLTHTGNNYYGCNGGTYLVTTRSQRYELDFKKLDKEAVGSNMVFQKTGGGDFLMSPFTTWKIQLVARTAIGFDVLKVYAAGCDLQLVGTGEYYERDAEICPGDLYEYYDAPNYGPKKGDECLEVLESGKFDTGSYCYKLYHKEMA